MVAVGSEYGDRDGGVLVDETPCLPKELAAGRDRGSSTWLPAITLSAVAAKKQRFARSGLTETDGVVEGLLASR